MAVIEVGADLVESAFYVIFLDLFNTRRLKGKKADACSFACFLLLFVNILISDMVTFYSCLPVVIDLVVTICYARLCLQGSIWAQMGSILLYQMGLIGAAVIVIGGLAFGKDMGLLLWMDVGSLERAFMLVGNKALLILYAMFLVRQRRKFEVRRTREAFLVFFLVPITVMVLVIVLLKLLFEIYYVDERGRMTVGIMVGIALLLAVVMYLYSKVVQKEQMEREKEYAVAMVAEQKQSYQDLLRRQADIRMMEHDMKNRLLGMKSYFVSGKIDKGVEKIDELLEIYRANAAGRVRGGCPWQTVIEMKLAYAREQGIAVENRVEEGDYSTVDDIDFCVILGNLLDNAIEAQIGGTDKRIRLYVSQDKGMAYVRLENSVPEGADIQMSRTSKMDSARHGFGIRSVKEIIKKYEGTIDFEISAGKVVATVLLQLPS